MNKLDTVEIWAALNALTSVGETWYKKDLLREEGARASALAERAKVQLKAVQDYALTLENAGVNLLTRAETAEEVARRALRDQKPMMLDKDGNRSIFDDVDAICGQPGSQRTILHSVREYTTNNQNVNVGASRFLADAIVHFFSFIA